MTPNPILIILILCCSLLVVCILAGFIAGILVSEMKKSNPQPEPPRVTKPYMVSNRVKGTAVKNPGWENET